ncbi:efflux RND transporter periplasmic adaptor subunit [Deltaproteobacteria bacterium OttesenSCG-928-M10]|nr:efflux RND transporter periplasmic adaptor subunit [Deltaproteobacteria bacterium OttesenSCG-928-M10]
MMMPQPQMQMPPAMVTLAPAREEVIDLKDRFIGLVEAERHVAIKPRVKGFLISRPFVEGDMVKKDQSLFKIEPTQYEAALTSAKASELAANAALIRAQADYERISGLYQKQTSTKADYDQYKATYDAAQAQVMQAQAEIVQAELNLGYTDIKAPFDGKISDSSYHAGSLIDPEDSQVLTTIVSLDPVLISFGISDQTLKKYRAKVKPRDTAIRIVAADEPYPHEGKLVFIDSMVNRKTDTIKFKASVENPDHVLVPGQMVMVEVVVGSGRPSILVPQKAVLTAPDGQRFVMTVSSEGQAAMNPVIVAGEHGQDYIISEGLTAGQEFILDGLVYMGGTPLQPGMPVQVMPNQPPSGQNQEIAVINGDPA